MISKLVSETREEFASSLLLWWWDLLKKDWKVKFNHPLREGNKAPDWLANYGIQGDLGLKVHSSPPQWLSLILVGDAMGVHTQDYVGSNLFVLSFFRVLPSLYPIQKKKKNCRGWFFVFFLKNNNNKETGLEFKERKIRHKWDVE